MIITVATTLVSPLYNYFLMFHYRLGLAGAAYAYNLSQATSLVLLLGYAVRRDHQLRGRPERTWDGWSSKALEGWGSYLSYGMPAAAMICMEWWMYEVVIFMAGTHYR